MIANFGTYFDLFKFKRNRAYITTIYVSIDNINKVNPVNILFQGKFYKNDMKIVNIKM